MLDMTKALHILFQRFARPNTSSLLPRVHTRFIHKSGSYDFPTKLFPSFFCRCIYS